MDHVAWLQDEDDNDMIAMMSDGPPADDNDAPSARSSEAGVTLQPDVREASEELGAVVADDVASHPKNASHSKPPVWMRARDYFIPKAFYFWRNWLAFAIVFAVLTLIIAFLPTDPSVIDPDNPPTVHWSSMVPPLLCIAFASCFRSAIWALSLGVFVGGTIAFKGNVYKIFEQCIFFVVWNTWNGYILGFMVGIIGFVFIVRRSNGLDSLLHQVMKISKTPRMTRILTAVGCFIFFFDGITNCMISGVLWRNLYDRMQISREKLAFIVDSTAAPVASVSFVSTWISYEISTIDRTIDTLNEDSSTNILYTAYEMFPLLLQTRFYCWTCLVMVFMCAILNRDYGPMLAAERREALRIKPLRGESDGTSTAKSDNGSFKTGVKADPGGGEHTEPKDINEVRRGRNKRDPSAPPLNAPLDRWYLALWPLLALIAGVILGLFIDGAAVVKAGGGEAYFWHAKSWQDVLGNAHSPKVIFWVSIACAGFAVGLVTYYRASSLDDQLRAWLYGFPVMFPACCILILAWGIKRVCDELGTADWIVSVIGDVDIKYIPFIVFVLSAITALCTGTSWGTMGIMIPIALTIVFTLSEKDATTRSGLIDAHERLWFLTCSAVLDGAVIGDHISPISDTSILAASAAGCPLMDHVKTQLPYAAMAVSFAGVLGYLAVGLGMPLWLYYIVAFVGIAIVWLLIGSAIPDPNPAGTAIEDAMDNGKYSIMTRLCLKCQCGGPCTKVYTFCGCVDPADVGYAKDTAYD